MSTDGRGVTWDDCLFCHTPYVLEDLRPVNTTAGLRHLCGWHYRQRFPAAAR